MSVFLFSGPKISNIKVYKEKYLKKPCPPEPQGHELR